MSEVWSLTLYTGIIGASLSEPHLGPYSGCGLCHIMMISYVLAPAYKRLYFIRDVT